MHANFSGDMCQYFMTVIQRDAEHGVRQCFFDDSFYLYKIFFCHNYKVRISGPLLVIAIPCSTCADGKPSSVTTVQPSDNTLVWCLPKFTIGSIAKTIPSFRTGP